MHRYRNRIQPVELFLRFYLGEIHVFKCGKKKKKNYWARGKPINQLGET